MKLDDAVVLVSFLHLIPILFFCFCGSWRSKINHPILLLLMGSFVSDVITTIFDQYNWNTTLVSVIYSLLEYYCFYRLIILFWEEKVGICNLGKYCFSVLLVLAPIVLGMRGEDKSIAIFWMIENTMIMIISVFLLFRLTGLETESQIDFSTFRILLIYFCYASIFFIPSIALIFVESYPKSEKWFVAYWIFAIAANLTRDILFSIYFMSNKKIGYGT